MALTFDNVRKSFDGVTILDGVSLALAGGEIVALTGESGSGKSTLLHIAAGLEPLDSGSVRVAGRDIATMRDAARAKLRRNAIGIVFQQFNLIPSLTVAANLTFQARLAGQAPDPSVLAEPLGLAPHLDKYPDQLSGGQQQRVAIGRALAARPALILADEPTGNLDEATGDAVMDLLLGQARTSGAALLLVTHSARLAARADRRLHLAHGRILS